MFNVLFDVLMCYITRQILSVCCFHQRTSKVCCGGHEPTTQTERGGGGAGWLQKEPITHWGTIPRYVGDVSDTRHTGFTSRPARHHHTVAVIEAARSPSMGATIRPSGALRRGPSNVPRALHFQKTPLALLEVHHTIVLKKLHQVAILRA